MDITRRTVLGAAALAASSSRSAASPNGKITVGMIGTGARAMELIEAIKQHPNAEIVGVVDAYKGRVERAISRTNGRAKAYPDHKALLADTGIDAVVIATPDHWHQTMIMDAMRAGKDVYCEKPLTYKASEGAAIAAEAAKRGRIVQVGSQGVSSSIGYKAREIVQSGKLGKVTTIRAAYNRNTASGAWIYPIPPDASPQTVDWQMFLGPAPKRPFSLERFFRWRCYEDYSGGIATDLFVHLCTTIHYVMNAVMPVRAMAMGEIFVRKEGREVPDTLNAILEYDGFVANLSSTFNNEMSGEGSFQFLGTEGSLTIAGGLIYTPENTVEDNKWIVESWSKGLEEQYWKDPKVIASEIEPRQRPRRQPEKIDTPGPDATVAHFGNFFASVESRKPWWEDALAGHHAAACAHMVNASVKQRKLIEWDFKKDDLKG